LRLWSKTDACRLDFLATSGNTGIFDEEARRLGAQIHYVRYGRDHLPQFAGELRRVLREGQYDVVHDHQDYASGWHFLMGAGALPPMRVTHLHNPAYQILNNYGVTVGRRLTAKIGRMLVARYSTHITGTSRRLIGEYGFDRRQFDKIPKGALYCGFNCARFLGDPVAAKASVCREFGWPQDATIILFAGRMDHSPDVGHPRNHKNSGFAAAVALECVRRDVRVHALFVGTRIYPAVSILEQKIELAGFSERIRFAGVRADIERLMLASNVLLFPSRGEGLGMVAVEAQAAGLPVLASTAVPSECIVVQELMRFKNIEAGPTQWAVDLLQLASRQRDVFAANRQVVVSPFTIENSASALFALYSKGSLTPNSFGSIAN